LIVEQAVGDAPVRPVLVVEDNHLNQIVAEGMLRLLGYPCRCVSDGL
jgi:CheY-like chemotaxis protein